MSQFVLEFDTIDEELEDKLIEKVKSDTRPFDTSMLYSISLGEKITDENVRNSSFKLFKDGETFDIVDKIVRKINGITPDKHFILVKNDVTYIKYVSGQYFKAHQDYLSMISNSVEEYTLIICISEKECEGGETVFTINEHTKITSKKSTIPKHAVMFRKDIIHESLPLLSGCKEIITLNLLQVSKDEKKIVVIKFKNDNREYVLSANKLTAFDNLFKVFIEINEEHSDDNIIYYEETNPDINYENFKYIYDIFTNKSMSHNNNMWLLDYYCIDLKNILSQEKIFLQPDTIIRPKVEETIKKYEDKIKNVKNEKKYKIEKDYKEEKKYSEKIKDYLAMVEPLVKISFTENIIYSLNNDNHKYLSSIIKKHDLPYISFRLLYAEGVLNVDDEGEGKIKGIIYSSFSDKENIMFARKTSVRNFCFWQFPQQPQNFESIEEEIYKEDKEYHTILYDDMFNDSGTCGPYVFNLNFCPLHEYSAYDLLSSGSEYDQGYPLKYCYMPPVYDKDNKLVRKLTNIHIAESIDDEVEYGTFKKLNVDNVRFRKYYNITKRGDTFLDKRHYQNVNNRIKELNFYDIKFSDIASLLSFPQATNQGKGNLCNESFYGNFTLLEVRGFIRMENYKV